ncbi:hypothetical protein GCM10009678_49780 [Actinomadura kijaniata]|uniref:Uncharacterized protein n=1 Tax=Actinomadura namibiensis TaxID=182080 RepID=A0A7W3LNT9_ACTNM|nr:hypothetical protein [Actinomadura namibiensis]MBA8951545.1 hypothetical protein [Actinomadura namibiensis]
MHPSLPDVAALAADGPRPVKSALTRAAKPLPAAELAPFFEDACRALLAAGEGDLAQWAFGQARKVDGDHPGTADPDRVHGVFLELVPAGGVAPAALRGYAAFLEERRAADEAYERFLEVLDAAFAAGVIPYARLFPDVRKLAKAAKVGRKAAERDLAERMLRAGVVPVASHQVWAGLREPLAALGGRGGTPLDLLVAAEPDRAFHEDESGPQIAEEIRQSWLATLAEAGAGARLGGEWFATVGRRCAAGTLVALVDQAGERLRPPAPSGAPDPGSDPAVPCDAALRLEPRRSPTIGALKSSATLLAETDDGFVTEITAGHLTGVAEALDRLGHPVHAEQAGRVAARLRETDLPDPVDLLVAALRAGVPAELGLPPRGETMWTPKASHRAVYQHGDHLAIGAGGWQGGLTAWDAAGGVVRNETLRHLPEGLDPWFDGTRVLVSRVADGRWQTFVVEGTVPTPGTDGESSALTYEPERAAARPQAPAEGEVTFPGAPGPSRVVLHRGVITVTGPDGTAGARLAFSPRQSAQDGLVPPPGWWGRRTPVDPEGSAALRVIGRETAEALVAAALRGPETAAAAVPRLLPEITEPALAKGVADLARTAADCLLTLEPWRERMGCGPAPVPAPPSPLHPLLAQPPGRPVGGGLGRLVSLRVMAGELTAAVAEVPDPPEAFLLRKVELAPGQYMLGQIFGRLAGYVYPAVFTGRAGALAGTRPWTASDWGDGSGRWRALELRSPERRRRDYVGELWRTPAGALLMLYMHDDRRTIAVEHAPDGRFCGFVPPGWEMPGEPIPQSRITPERLAALEGLLAARGPVVADPAWAHDLAGRTGMGLPSAARLLFGNREGRLSAETAPPGVAELLAAPEGTGHGLAYPQVDLFRERLLPDAPADLWETGPDVGAAAAWWRAFTGG